MAPHPTTVLGLVLCLGQMIHMQNGLLPRPSIRAQPGPVVPRGRPVTILCLGPAGADLFRLKQKENIFDFTDQKITSQHGSPGAEARFPIRAVSDVTAGPYRCVYKKGSRWSEFSEALELVLTGGPGEVTPLPTEVGSQTAPASRNYMAGNCIHIGLAGVVLLILVAILAEAGHSQHTSPHRTQEDAHQKD
ncbi:leukocyte-associated immunoglobulin-like receptor 2 isoform X2 [Rhinolophus ferrumequinum]|nr:leukocyte-associated immunoglobulin-like receptor 2 isoform X2 [Rhinolophus ferrumequinum]